jgi:hypothetical protein
LQARSPIFTHAANTSTGIVTIRAIKRQPRLLEEYENHYDDHTKAFFAVISVNRWFGIRLNGIVVFYTIFIVYACILAKGKNLVFSFLIPLSYSCVAYRMSCLNDLLYLILIYFIFRPSKN